MFSNVAELIALAEEGSCSIAEIMIRQEMEVSGKSLEQIRGQMSRNLEVMEKAVERGLSGVKSHSGLTGGDAVKMHQYISSGQGLSGFTVLDAVSKAVATNEVNAAMGLICATPTAGASGVIPGVLFALVDKLHPTRDQMIDFLFTSGAFGMVVANNASISGAAGGCQAEVGSATGMAAASIVALAGGTPQQSATAMAIALKNLLGLVCDPVAGLVEVPCVKRNAMGAAIAMVAADMSLAGITSAIPCDEVIEAMYRIGQSMPVALRETAQGGLADTPTGRRLKKEILNGEQN
ncbi:L-serine ammonia-lyase, iron-sulfur-dependent, subunit alpha [Paenibacillus sp. D2_2]|uniref:L-serine ammonia-lyase, iron-sulfur-dependent, subunit alpha n=1 Tax=Paenibacillus sp. D2_2 TaxID=3073092 RepID=UPI002815A2D9|nr:L-serine ammonia-lyase, iron-sulfur-dependent, subunit alpha [Paenibacillus sp. D2_2]WMT40009.1 L-serine ammonia-lyase, iron-sulfur-dependent, subunit alpha [Paenibacillus sp. D2_2]